MVTVATRSTSFDDDLRLAVRQLRGALIELYISAGADPARPQDVSRRFGVNRNLAWKVARIIQDEDVYGAVPLIPGGGGLDILLEQLQAGGASPEIVTRVREAIAAFDQMIEIHMGDRATLELAIDAMSRTDALEASRKLAFRGNSGVWGIRAAARVNTYILAPNRKDPTRLDIALITGLTHVLRLRPVVGLPVFTHWRWIGETVLEKREWLSEPLPTATGTGMYRLNRFCSGALPEMHIRKSTNHETYELGEGPVGKTGEFTCYFGHVDRAAVPRYRSPADRHGELMGMISLPVESAVFDVFYRHDIPEVGRAESVLYGRNTAMPGFDPGSSRLPCSDRPIDLGRGAMLATPLVPRYDELMDYSIRACGWDPADFHCLRLIMAFPPMGATASLRYALADDPAGG